jgi:hypothetical protein
MHRHTHRAAGLTVALVAAVLFVSPVWAAKPAGTGGDGGGGSANGGGNQGSVRVGDAVSGLESLTNNEPHVCAFFLAFDGAPNGESGSWSIVDWPPTGDGTEVEDGTYLIPAGGSSVTDTFVLDAGHYRVIWQGINDQNEKHKTFWVEDDCVAAGPGDQPGDQPGDEVPPEDPPADEPQDDPTEQPQDQPEDPPADEPQGDPEDQPADEPVDEPQDDPAEQPQEDPQDQPADEPGEGDVEDAVEGPPAPDEEPASDSQPVDEPDPENDLAPGTGNQPIVSELPDSAMDAPVLPGLGAALAILLLVAVHRTVRQRSLTAQR